MKNVERVKEKEIYRGKRETKGKMEERKRNTKRGGDLYFVK